MFALRRNANGSSHPQGDSPLTIIWANSVSYHYGCDMESSSSPLSPREAQLRKTNPGRDPHFNEIVTKRFNDDARRLAASIGARLVNMDYVTAARIDAHPGCIEAGRDCLHYLAPGPLDVIPRLLNHFLEVASIE